ncbi:hypothetical protein ERD95_25450 [Enterobacteriaceae bacterium ML5]|nr:hypothetical protein ERD95_25450 [Enterobacteriaceae bacterium ML5]
MPEGGKRPSPRERRPLRDRGEDAQPTHRQREGGRKNLPPDFHLGAERHFIVITTAEGTGAGVVHG